ncbi:putative sugar nucleotidyl transferase [Patescibacteria group bacterium]
MRKKKNKPEQIKVTAVCVFEDRTIETFEPLHYFHPVWELQLGATSLCERIFREFPKSEPVLSCRESIASILDFSDDIEINSYEPGDYLFVNGRLAEPRALLEQIELKGPSVLYVQGDVIVAARIRLTKSYEGDMYELLESLGDSMPREEISVRLYSYLWELVDDNADAITEDGKQFELGKRKGAIYATTVLINPKQVYLPESSSAGPGVVLDASEGPIIIDDNVEIMPNAVLKGPIYVGEGSKIKSGALIYEGTSIGHTCKVGGEVEKSIFLAFSNKQHTGFIGHSYIGSWCNLGEGSSNSDLKNTYSRVKVLLNNKPVETERQFVGIFMGDHVKTGIHSMFTTGSVIGPMSNVFGGGFQPKYLPPFSWQDVNKKLQEYDLSKAIEVSARVMKRRDQALTEELKEYILDLHKSTKKLRS